MQSRFFLNLRGIRSPGRTSRTRSAPVSPASPPPHPPRTRSSNEGGAEGRGRGQRGQNPSPRRGENREIFKHNVTYLSNFGHFCYQENDKGILWVKFDQKFSYPPPPFPALLQVCNTTTECPEIYRKSVQHLLKYSFAVYLSWCSTDLR